MCEPVFEMSDQLRKVPAIRYNLIRIPPHKHTKAFIMKIARIKLHPVTISRRTGVHNQHIIVQLETDDDYIGWGEMSDLSHLPLFQMDFANLESALNDLLRGMDAQNIAEIETVMERFYPFEGHKYSRAGLVREGIDLALHDLHGRKNGVSVSTLLGGAVRDRIKVCYPIFRMRSDSEIEPNLTRIAEMLERGFDLIRVYVGANIETDIHFFQQFNDRFGDTVQIKSLDFSNLLDWRRAWQATKRYADLVEFMLLESAAQEDDFDGMVEFRRRSHWPISEHVNHIHHAWHFAHIGAVDIFNISPYVLGGIRACQRVIALAEASRTSVLIGTTRNSISARQPLPIWVQWRVYSIIPATILARNFIRLMSSKSLFLMKTVTCLCQMALGWVLKLTKTNCANIRLMPHSPSEPIWSAFWIALLPVIGIYQKRANSVWPGRVSYKSQWL